jgi:outer membrane immunogenic protein
MKARLHLLSTVSALALAGSAFAADMPVKAPPPVVVVAPSWTGFYVGGHGGIGWLRHKQTITSGAGNVCSLAVLGNPPFETCSIEDTGAVAGGQIGYLLQYQQFVIGIEADGSWTGLNKSASFASFPGFQGVFDAKVEWLTSVRGRLGVAVNDWLFYGTGGVAWASVNEGWQAPFGPALNARLNKTISGWVAGGGIEKMFGRNWSVRAEYLYYGLRSTTNVVTVPNFGTYSTAFRNDVSVVRLGINFRPNP